MNLKSRLSILLLLLVAPIACAQIPAAASQPAAAAPALQPPAPAATATAQPAGVIGPDLLSVADIAAATANTPAISFDVFTIKANNSASPLRALENPLDGDGITLSNLTLFDIMRWNFNIRSFREDQLAAVPGWFTSERFDIQAKVAAADVPVWRKLSEGQRRLVFRKLLVEQFKLAAHWANVEQADYNLVIAKGGLKIKPVKEGDPNPDAPKGPDGTPVKGNGIFLIDRSPSGLKFAFQETHLGWFAKGFLPSYAGRQVYDKTGIPDDTIYNFTLEFTPERSTAPVMPGSDSGEASAPPPESGPSIFTALQEQLGLKLEPGKGPVGRLVIDHIEKPSEN
jgi:uncharacterized protein (TIGR03435 family)